MPRYFVGQLVAVHHHTCGEWVGIITWVNDTGEGVEYEVSNSPEDLGKRDSIFNQPGHRWFPLCWEIEIVPLLTGATS